MAPARRLLHTHRGYDLGALPLARLLATQLRAPLFAARCTRLLVDANRSPTNPAVFSVFTRCLDRGTRAALLAEHHAPHRAAVAAAISRALGTHRTVLHLAIHSFTPRLRGVTRRTDIGILYDPGRRLELRQADHLRTALRQAAPQWRVRRNDPYRGTADGLPTWLRRQMPLRYAGIELEVSQRLLGDARQRQQVARVLFAAIASLLGPRPRR